MKRTQARGKRITLTAHPDVNVGGRRQTGYRIDIHRTGIADFLTGDELREIAVLADAHLTTPPGACPECGNADHYCGACGVSLNA